MAQKKPEPQAQKIDLGLQVEPVVEQNNETPETKNRSKPDNAH